MVVMVQNYLEISEKSYLKGSFIGIYTSNLEITYASKVSTNGMGCSMSEGLGCGFLDWIIGLRL